MVYIPWTGYSPKWADEKRMKAHKLAQKQQREKGENINSFYQ